MLWTLALAPFFVVLALRWAPGPSGEGTDTYHYLLHARSLAEGSGYSDTGYIFSDYNPWIGPQVQPPGLPLLLYPVFKVFGENLLLVRLAGVVFAVAFLLMAGRYFAVHEGLYFGLAVTLLVGLIANLPTRASFPFSDFPSGAAIWAVVLATDSERPFDWRKLTFITVVGAAATATRLTGIALFGALVVFALVRYREFYLRPLIPAMVWGFGGAGALYVFGIVLPFWALDGAFTRPWTLVWRWYYKAFNYRLPLLENTLYPFPWDTANDLYHVAAAALMILGLLAWLPKVWNRFVFYFAISYLLMLLSLPVSGGDRYFWPIAPVLIFLILNGCRTLVRWVSPRAPERRREAAVLAIAAVIGLCTLATLASTPRDEALVESAELQEVFAYLRGLETPPDTRIAFHYPRLMSWETRIASMALPDRGAVDGRVEELRSKRITYVVSSERLGDMIEETLLREALRERPTAFSLAHQGNGFAVYRVR